MSERYCPKCDTVFYNGQHLCPDCGSEMREHTTEERYCPDCKNMFYNGQKNCPDCGALMYKPSAVEKVSFEKKMQSSMETETKYEQKNGKIEVWHIIAAIAVAVMGILAAPSLGESWLLIVIFNLLFVLEILFPTKVGKRGLKRFARLSSVNANIVRIGAIAIAVLVNVIFLT